MTEKATFALGCFWGPDDYFSHIPGVISTLVGYSGGEKEHPTYRDLGDHTESIEIVFDPKEISYSELLDHFWSQHDPTLKFKTQYKSAIFYHDDEQKRLAEESKKDKERELGKPVVTEIHKAGKFTLAEDYHQKYLQKNKGSFC